MREKKSPVSRGEFVEIRREMRGEKSPVSRGEIVEIRREIRGREIRGILRPPGGNSTALQPVTDRL